jgi:hypothetical protein
VHFYPRGKQEYGEERNIIDKQKKIRKKKKISAQHLPLRTSSAEPQFTTTLMQQTRRFN